VAEPTVQDNAKLVVIQTDKGKVRCSQFDRHLEGLGIPYAAPPIGRPAAEGARRACPMD
jgi:hypothetical protein